MVCVQPAGGLTSALTPIVSAAGGTWVAQASGSADRETACARGRLAVPPENPCFNLRRLWIPEQLQHRYYEGLANQALWPLCHHVYQRPTFRSCDWQAYQRVNEMFAEAVLEEAGNSRAVVFVQDYHLALLPRMLKNRNPALTVAQFWHIPWAGCEAMQTFPWLEELLDGLLGNDLLGFHLPQHCSNFIDTVESSLEADSHREHGSIRYGAQPTVVRSAPISIDFERHASDAASAETEAAMRCWRSRIGEAAYLGVGIDRIDYTKGVPERLRAIGVLLERFPHLREKLTFVQVAVPSRSSIPEYAQLTQEIEEAAAAINNRWGSARWKPILLEQRNLPPVEMMALHRLANFCLVTSLHDGMNLVAKEFAASRFDNDGVLVLSRFAGAARELTTALHVNPFSEESICQSIMKALSMPRSERQRRMSEMRAVVENNNIYRWAGTLIEEMAGLNRIEAPGRIAHYERLTASVA